MKAINKLGIALAFAGGLFFSSCGEGSYYVSSQPTETYYERPVSPYRGAVWIEGDWVWSGGRYVRRSGRWVRPRANRVWVGGSWQSTPRGYTWRKGYWR